MIPVHLYALLTLPVNKLRFHLGIHDLLVMVQAVVSRQHVADGHGDGIIEQDVYKRQL